MPFASAAVSYTHWTVYGLQSLPVMSDEAGSGARNIRFFSPATFSIAIDEDDELFRHAGAEDAAPAPLAPMTPIERVQQDFLLTGLTTGQHPLALLRDRLPGVQRAADLPTLAPRTRVCIGGSVITRQRPGTAKGVCFITLEDETGLANAIVRPALFERERLTINLEPSLLITGRLQNEKGVIHILAEVIRPLPAAGLPAQSSHDFR